MSEFNTVQANMERDLDALTDRLGQMQRQLFNRVLQERAEADTTLQELDAL